MIKQKKEKKEKAYTRAMILNQDNDRYTESKPQDWMEWVLLFSLLVITFP